ncbi:hypothetical protein N9Y00_07915 [Tateyamaria sp.]|nr:hypothetical protein [Tateyamaria sp.]
MNWFWKYLPRRFRPQPSVEGIVASFNKTVRKLETVAADQEAEAVRQEEAAKAAENRAEDAVKEGSRARAVAANLNNLVAG